MTPLDNPQKQLLFDYCLGLTSEQETAEAEALISSEKQAAELHSKLKSAIAPLGSLEIEPCPDGLAERTIGRLNERARSAQVQLEQLLAAEQSGGVLVKNHFWMKLAKVAAAAAVILVLMGTWFAPLELVRAKYRQHQCRMQLGHIARGTDQYSSDYDDALPAVASEEGGPWWKVADQGKENHSNTRHIWLLVKGDYVKPRNFVCPGWRRGEVLRFSDLQVQDYNDFPARKYITYSFRIICQRPMKRSQFGAKVLMADLNPLSEKLPEDYSKSLKLRLDEDMLRLNSINHNRTGQNVLSGDGSARFTKIRQVGVAEDDIFTLQDMSSGCEVKGCEVPSCETDAFCAP